MKKVTDVLLSRRLSYALSGTAMALAFVLPSPYRLLLLTAAVANLAVTWQMGRKRMKRIGLPLAIVAILGLLMPRQAVAIFGLGDIVFDPSAYGQMIAQVAQLREMYQNAVQLYTTTVQSYEIAKHNIL